MDGGADCRKTSFPPCRLRHPHRHAVHDDSRRDGKKKAAFGRSKSPAFAGTKTAANRGPSPNSPESPSPALPKGRELIPAEFKDVGVLLLPLGEGWDGASMSGWGFYVGWCAPLATL